jgi:hypothetical protein
MLSVNEPITTWQAAQLILESDWLQQHDAKVQADTFEEAKQIADETSDSFVHLYRIDYLYRLDREIAIRAVPANKGGDE